MVLCNLCASHGDAHFYSHHGTENIRQTNDAIGGNLRVTHARAHGTAPVLLYRSLELTVSSEVKIQSTFREMFAKWG